MVIFLAAAAPVYSKRPIRKGVRYLFEGWWLVCASYKYLKSFLGKYSVGQNQNCHCQFVIFFNFTVCITFLHIITAQVSTVIDLEFFIQKMNKGTHV